MKMCHGWVICLFLSISGLRAQAEYVTGTLDGNVKLPCTYLGQTTTMCWGRGGCPNSKCNDEIIRTDGQKVTWRKSDRYQLLGDIDQRDVSLTITGATKEDEGTYCCRVEIDGWFNDLKKEFIVKIQEDNPVTARTPDHHHTTTEDDMFSMLEECPDDDSD